MTDEEGRTCTKCGEWKEWEGFNHKKTGKCGREARCRACSNKASLEWGARNREHRARYYVENRDHNLAYKARWDAEHREHNARRAARWREMNWEHDFNRRREYRNNNPHIGWMDRYLRRCGEYGLEPVTEEFTRVDVIEAYGDGCSYCGEGAFENLDHYVPVSKGGPHVLSNVRPSCRPCNQAKWVRDPEEFSAGLGGAREAR